MADSPPSLVPDYAIRYYNGSVSTFEMLDAGIQPLNSGAPPPPGFTLKPDEEYIMPWEYRPDEPENSGQTFGYLRFWSIAEFPNEPGSGTAFGVKIDEQRIATSLQPENLSKVLTFVGSPTRSASADAGTPAPSAEAWTDVTKHLDQKPPPIEDYKFTVPGPSITRYEVTLKSYGPEDSPFVVSRRFVDAIITAVY